MRAGAPGAAEVGLAPHRTRAAVPIIHEPMASARRRPVIFDVYLMVDWSGASGSTGRSPRADAVWVAETGWDGPRTAWQPELYFDTRRRCLEHLVRRLGAHLAARRRVLAGFDFSLGYPAGLARALGLAGRPWRATWEALARPGLLWPGAPDNAYATEDNRNDRFAVASAFNRRVARGARQAAGPFYGCPRRLETAWLHAARPPFPFSAAGVSLPYHREAERRLAHRRICSGWWVLGGGAPTVGGQAIVGIPAVRELAARLGAAARVWPFETGFSPAVNDGHGGGAVVLAEIWPNLVNHLREPGRVRERAPVRAVAGWAARADETGELRRRIGPPDGLSGRALTHVIEEEGWILGA